jgi:putative ABC transport system ATP-binding protein
VSGCSIAVANVRKSFEAGRVKALRDVSFAIEPGELVALTGASGSGKSTLLNLLGALDVPDAGSIEIDGRPLEEFGSPSVYRAETVGFIFQAHNLLPTLTARENVQIPMFGRRPRRERQRVAIARALANDPRLLLADEPTGALDSTTGKQVLELLDRLCRQRGTTIVLVTNDEEVAVHATRRLHLSDGVIRAVARQPEPA